MARRLLIMFGIAALVIPLGLPAAAADEVATGWNEDTGIYEMVFPVLGENDYDDTWGACRGRGCRRKHKGTDIMADKMVPVVAVASGTVGWISSERNRECCSLEIVHDDGWSSWYVHLNNDRPGTDDGRGWGIAPGIAGGVRVEAGELIGWVGDSGNAETTPPHLHFELQTPEDEEINPYPHLIAAEQAAAEAAAAEAAAAEAAADADRFEDPFIDGELLEAVVEAVLRLQSGEDQPAIEPEAVEIS